MQAPFAYDFESTLLQVVTTAQGKALADEYSIKFFETSAKTNRNVTDAFTAIATDIKKRLMDNPNTPGAAPAIRLDTNNAKSSGGKCCK